MIEQGRLSFEAVALEVGLETANECSMPSCASVGNPRNRCAALSVTASTSDALIPFLPSRFSDSRRRCGALARAKRRLFRSTHNGLKCRFFDRYPKPTQPKIRPMSSEEHLKLNTPHGERSHRIGQWLLRLFCVSSPDISTSLSTWVIQYDRYQESHFCPRSLG